MGTSVPQDPVYLRRFTSSSQIDVPGYVLFGKDCEFS